MGFTKNFNYCMEQYGYSAYRFAKIIGANNQSVVNWLYGSNVPHPKTRQKIAYHFGITLAELGGDELPVLPEDGAKKPTIRRPRARMRSLRSLLPGLDGCLRSRRARCLL